MLLAWPEEANHHLEIGVLERQNVGVPVVQP